MCCWRANASTAAMRAVVAGCVLSNHFGKVAEVCLNKGHISRRAQTKLRRSKRIGILVEANQFPGASQALTDENGMPASPCRCIDVRSTGLDAKSINTLV